MIDAEKGRPDVPPPKKRLAVLRVLSRLKRRLRARWLIVAELAGLVVAGVFLTLLPQQSWAPPGEMSRFELQNPTLYAIVRALTLDRITASWWFLALVVLSACSLIAVQIDQWRLVGRLWRARLKQEHFQRATYRREITRPKSEQHDARSTFHSKGRVGLLGSPLFHFGLLLVVVAGALRLLFAQTAVVDVVEGETVAPAPKAYAAQWGGRLSTPFALEKPLEFRRLQIERYPSGKVSGLSAELVYGAERFQGRVNAPLRFGDELIHLSGVHGPAALVELRAAGQTHRLALLMKGARGPLTYEGEAEVGELQLRLRASIARDGALPQVVEARLLRKGALLKVGRLRVGHGFAFGAKGRVDLRELRHWGRLRGSRDAFLWLAFLGFTLITLGGTLAVALVRVDSAVIVTPTEEGEKVLVALKPQRFAPLYAERFAAMVQKEEERGS